jgi:ribosomal protein S12 methylthiotransferase accessory factor
MWALDPANRRAFDFLYDSPLAGDLDSVESLERGDPKRNRDQLVRCLADVGLEPWAWDIGNEETSFSGFRIVKVEVPGLCHLVPGRQSRRLACERFERVPVALSRPCLPPGEQNPDPHIQA